MPLYDDWCDSTEQIDKKKRYWCLSEKDGGRDAVTPRLAETVRSHYDRTERIAEDVERLGYEAAAVILRKRLPTRANARSGDLGEILASELVEERVGFRIPVRRMRYKDGREVAMRGDDFIGVGFDKADGLWLLKGEAKSRATLSKTTITEAREALNRDAGRCTPDSLLFVADRLLESADPDDVALGRQIRDETGLDALRPSRIDHMLFTLSGNVTPESQKADLDASSEDRRQYSVNFRVADHQAFIAVIYAEALKLGE